MSGGIFMNKNLYYKILDGIIDDYKELKYRNNLDKVDFFCFTLKNIANCEKQYSQYFTLENIHTPNIIVPYSHEQIEAIVLNFFKSLNNAFYKQALDFLTNQNGCTSIYHDSDPNSYSHLEHWSYQISLNLKKSSPIYSAHSKLVMKPEHTLLDIFILAHEIAHSFPYDANNFNFENSFLSETISFFTESMLDNYLQKLRNCFRTICCQKKSIKVR